MSILNAAKVDGLADKIWRWLASAALAFIFFFAAWTVFCNVSVLLGLEYAVFRVWALAALAAALAAGTWAFWKGYPAPSAGESDEPAPGGAAEGWRLLWPIGAGIALVAAYRLTGLYLAFWLLLIAYFALCLRSVWDRASPVRYGTAVATGSDLAVFGLGLVLAVGYVAMRTSWSLDEPFYINLITGLLDHPDAAILRYDTMHNVAGLPVMNASYRVVSLEPLQAVIADFCAVDPIWLRQLVFAPISAVLSVTFLGLAFQKLVGRAWATAVVSYVLVAFLWSTAFRMIGGFHYNILSVDKAVLVSIVVPGLVWATLTWWERRSWWTWGILAAFCITAPGLTPNGLFAAPATIGLLSLAHLRPRRDSLVRFLGGLSAAFYPLLVGAIVFLFSDVRGSEEAGGHHTAVQSVRTGWGWDWRFWFLLLVVTAGGAAIRERRLRYLYWAWTAAYFLSVGNPFLANVWGALTGGLAWRLSWSFPVLMLLVLALHEGVKRLSGKTAVQGLVPAVLLAGSLLSNQSTISPDHWADFQAPARKLPREEFALAARLNDLLGPDDVVLAPPVVASYMTTFPHHPTPIVTRPLYLFHLRPWLKPEDFEERVKLASLVDPGALNEADLGLVMGILEKKEGRPRVEIAATAPLLAEQNIRSGRLQAIVRKKEDRLDPSLSALMEKTGRSFETADYVVWISAKIAGRNAAAGEP
jgi:hypothetical protein